MLFENMDRVLSVAGNEVFLMWEDWSWRKPLPNLGRDLPIYITGLEGREDTDWFSNDGATVAPRISTEKLIPVVSAGRCFPMDQMGQAGPWDETDQSVFPGSESEYSRNV